MGTAFGVRARAGEPAVRVVVTEGSVLLRQADATAGTGTVLDRGDLGELDASGRTQVARDVDVQAHLGWLRGRMAYDAAPARTIAHDIERWYGVTVRIEDAVADTTRLTMTMDVRQPATLSLKRLAEVLDLRLVHEGTQARLLPRVPVATH